MKKLNQVEKWLGIKFTDVFKKNLNSVPNKSWVWGKQFCLRENPSRFMSVAIGILDFSPVLSWSLECNYGISRKSSSNKVYETEDDIMSQYSLRFYDKNEKEIKWKKIILKYR